MLKKGVNQKALVGLMLFSMFLWGLSWPSGKVLTRYCSPVNIAAYRFAIVFVTLLILLALRRSRPTVKKAGISAIIGSGMLLATYAIFFFRGLKAGTAGAGGVLVTTLNPIMSYAIGVLISRRMPSRNESLGLIMGVLAGCVLLKVWDNPMEILASGNLYFLLAAITWATMSQITSRGSKYGTSLGFSFWQYLVTMLCLFPFINGQELIHTLHIRDVYFWGNLFFSSAIVTAIATTIYFYATTRLGAEKASSFIFMVPLAAAVSSWLLLSEPIMLHTAIGGALGISAVYMINKTKTSPVANER